MCSSRDDVASMSTSELVDAAAAIAAELAQRRPPDSAAVCMRDTETLARATDLHESALAGLIARVDASGETRRWGCPSVRSWLRTRLGMREARAKERIALAREHHRLPRVAERLASGELSYGYAATVAAAVTRLDDEDCAAAEDILLELAGKGFSAGKVAAFGNRITDLIAERDGTEAPDADSRRGYERSWIDSTRSLDGGRYVKGWLNAEDAAIWDGTLGPLAKPAGSDDDRDLSERVAAALSGVLSGGHRATKVTVICDLDTLTGGQAPARRTDGTPIPAEQARRIALTAGVSPLLLGRGHVPLYLGRTIRFATPGQRRVLEALNPTCAVQGCEVPGTLCEVDHVAGWALDHSPTDIDNLTLTCGFHNRHKAANPSQIHISRDQNGRYTYRLLPPDHLPLPGRLLPPGNLPPPGQMNDHRRNNAADPDHVSDSVHVTDPDDFGNLWDLWDHSDLGDLGDRGDAGDRSRPPTRTANAWDDPITPRAPGNADTRRPSRHLQHRRRPRPPRTNAPTPGGPRQTSGP